MRKMWILVLLLFLSGSTRQEPIPRLSVVTQVDIDCRHGQTSIRRHYTQPEKVESVLNYLRMQENLGIAQTDPERIIGDVYTIDISLSDGRHHIYQQRADRYLSRDYHPWQKIDEEQARMFYGLLRQNESDV